MATPPRGGCQAGLVLIEAHARPRGIPPSCEVSAPPDRPELLPYRPALRDDIAPGARWFGCLSID